MVLKSRIEKFSRVKKYKNKKDFCSQRKQLESEEWNSLVKTFSGV